MPDLGQGWGIADRIRAMAIELRYSRTQITDENIRAIQYALNELYDELNKKT
jgi:hypothetical protein